MKEGVNSNWMSSMVYADFRRWSAGLRSNMSNALQRIASNLDPDDKKWIEEQIENIRTELTDGYSEITGLRSDYKELVRNYFERSKPFPSPLNTFQSDLKQYRTLIAHAMVLEDLAFLKYWGVEYPRSENFKVLADDVSSYVMAFQRICDNSKYRKENDIPEGAVPYYRELSKSLSD